MRKTHLTVLAIVTAVVILAIGAVTAYADIASDSEKPVTTTNATASYWDAAAITIHAADNEGVAYIYHKLDGHPVRLSTIDGKPLVRMSPSRPPRTVLSASGPTRSNTGRRTSTATSRRSTR